MVAAAAHQAHVLPGRSCARGAVDDRRRPIARQVRAAPLGVVREDEQRRARRRPRRLRREPSRSRPRRGSRSAPAPGCSRRSRLGGRAPTPRALRDLGRDLLARALESGGNVNAFRMTAAAVGEVRLGLPVADQIGVVGRSEDPWLEREGGALLDRGTNGRRLGRASLAEPDDRDERRGIRHAGDLHSGASRASRSNRSSSCPAAIALPPRVVEPARVEHELGAVPLRERRPAAYWNIWLPRRPISRVTITAGAILARRGGRPEPRRRRRRAGRLRRVAREAPAGRRHVAVPVRALGPDDVARAVEAARRAQPPGPPRRPSPAATSSARSR